MKPWAVTITMSLPPVEGMNADTLRSPEAMFHPDSGRIEVMWKRIVYALTVHGASIVSVEFIERHALKQFNLDVGDATALAVSVVPA